MLLLIPSSSKPSALRCVKGGASLNPALQSALCISQLGGRIFHLTPPQPRLRPPYQPRARRGGTDRRDLKPPAWSRPPSLTADYFPYVRSERGGGGAGGRGGCVSAARAPAEGARPASPRGPLRGCKDDRRGGGGGRALSRTCRSPRYGAARALAPCFSATKVAASVWPAGPGPRCRAARWVLGGRYSGSSASRAGRSPSVRWCELRGGPQAPGSPDSADPEPGGRLHPGRELAAPGLRPALAGGVAVTGPGLGAGTFASVYQNLRFDCRGLSGLNQ